MILHTVNKSPYRSQQLLNCLARAKAGDRILLIEDGVYGLNWSDDADDIASALTLPLQFYALLPDIQARGLMRLLENPSAITLPCQVVSDEQFVDLVVEADKVISWY